MYYMIYYQGILNYYIMYILKLLFQGENHSTPDKINIIITINNITQHL